MKSRSGKLALSVAWMVLLSTAAYAQTPDDAVQSSHPGAMYSPPYPSEGTNGAGSPEGPLYNATVSPVYDQAGVTCLGEQGIGSYPNPVAYGDSSAAIESGGEYNLDRGYHGCFTHIGE